MRAASVLILDGGSLARAVETVLTAKGSSIGVEDLIIGSALGNRNNQIIPPDGNEVQNHHKLVSLGVDTAVGEDEVWLLDGWKR